MKERETIAALAAKMAGEGIRRLLVLSGDDRWVLVQALRLRQHLGGRAVWTGPEPQAAPCCPPSSLTKLLGREFHHAFFDARRSFDAAAFAGLAGTLVPGSWLVLLAPDFTLWSQRPDGDSLRWSDSPEPIAAPHFIRHFCRCLTEDKEVVVWRQSAPLTLPQFCDRPRWQAASGQPLTEQNEVLRVLQNMPPGVAVVTAGRGRGKSALAGMHLRRLDGTAIVTAPAKGATDILAGFAGERFRFMAPDVLLASDEQADWLVVDEAAALPGPMLEQLVRRFSRTLLTTTVQGYEGTGRGFLLKFCARFPHLQTFTLSQPVRWAAGCPLEALVDRAMLFDDTLPSVSGAGTLQIQRTEQAAWQENSPLPESMYRLLCAAHYRTSPLDLRRMMDAPGQHFACAWYNDGVVGALWLVEEGGLSPALSQAVWAGYRRPRGNLVAQSLAAHGGSPLAATLKGLRISRIAVQPQHQRQKIGQRMIAHATEENRDYDYLSVSFGYTHELWHFWECCGFTLVRVGTHREASSGCYTAMALYPLSAAGHELAHKEQQRLTRDSQWLDLWRDLRLAVPEVPPETILTDDDWLELAGFAWAHRPLMTAVASLHRLVANSDLPLPALRGSLQQRPEHLLCQQLNLSGRKALLAAIRADVATALAELDGERSALLAEQITDLQF